MMTSVTGDVLVCKRAFTFVELLLVVVIIGTFIAVSVPRMRNTFNSLQLNNFSYDLRNFMNYLEQRAIVEGKLILLNFDSNSAKYWASNTDDGKRIATFSVPSGIKVESGNAQLAFYPDGSTDKAEIRLKGAENKRIILSTNGVSGNVKIRNE